MDRRRVILKSGLIEFAGTLPTAIGKSYAQSFRRSQCCKNRVANALYTRIIDFRFDIFSKRFHDNRTGPMPSSDGKQNNITKKKKSHRKTQRDNYPVLGVLLLFISPSAEVVTLASDILLLLLLGIMHITIHDNTTGQYYGEN